MRKRSILRRLAVAAAIAAGTVTTALPASAAPATSIQAATSTSTQAAVSPADVGSIVCSDNICIQRISSIVGGKANVKAWAWHNNFTGTFLLTGGQYVGTFSQDTTWVAGGTGWTYYGLASGSPKILYSITATADNLTFEGQVNFTI